MNSISRAMRRRCRMPLRASVLGFVLIALLLPMSGRRAVAQEMRDELPDPIHLDLLKSAVNPAPTAPAASDFGGINLSKLPDLGKRENVSAAIQLMLLLTVLSLAPAILIMMTSFTRIIIVLSLLRQALGTQQLPPNQVLIGLALFMTFVVMGPTWQRINSEALQPYMNGTLPQDEAMTTAQIPLREFMIRQIRYAKNDEDVYLMSQVSDKPKPKVWQDVGTLTLVPAFMLSELKTAFTMGFTIYLPFLAVDIVVSTILVSMGMMMLPPVLISLPFKLLLFVLVDGWRLITSTLIVSFTGS